MKLIYSELKKFLPDLSVAPEKLRDDLSLIGHFCNYFEKKEGDFVFDLDIKVNRGDCLGYYGLARDLAVFYNIPLEIEKCKLKIENLDFNLSITVTAKNEVKRLQAIKISGLKNTISPDWLKNFLELHQINSINTLVDLTNYAMLIWGIPNHAFDTAKSTDNLVWELNSKYPEFTTLDNVNLKLKPGVLMVNSPNKALSLSFLGGSDCAIDLATTETIIEMAVYNPARVRQDYKFLKTITEAAIRLEKDLDPDTIPLAFNHLASLILEHCGGKIASSLFDYYPTPLTPPQIDFDPQKPSLYAGITISSEFSLNCLKLLGCQLTSSPLPCPAPDGSRGDREGFKIIPPSIRADLSIEEDLVEEVIRFYGFNKIPTTKPLANQSCPDITPKVLYLIESLKDKLVALGYDEIRSWPLVQQPLNNQVIKTQNSINSEFPYLRQSIIQSLEFQLDQYQRYKLPNPQFFEIGKIFYQQNGQYLEKYSLGLYHHNPDQLKSDLVSLTVPGTRRVKGRFRGIGNFAEIILDDIAPPETYSPKITTNEAIELTSQIITLDANITLSEKRDHQELIREYQLKISGNLLWQILITDEYFDSKANLYRYTFRVSYYNCTDKLAKSTHLSAFNLI